MPAPSWQRPAPAEEGGYGRCAPLGSAADKVDNFKLVASVDDRFSPVGAGDNASVVFNGYAVAFEPERIDKIGKSRRGSQVPEPRGLPVKDKLNVVNFPEGRTCR